jgi:hypothetical protein
VPPPPTSGRPALRPSAAVPKPHPVAPPGVPRPPPRGDAPAPRAAAAAAGTDGDSRGVAGGPVRPMWRSGAAGMC